MFTLTPAGKINIATPGLHLVRVDSDQATKWLKLNIKNRRLRKTLVEYLKRQIASGEWKGNHPQPVVFSNAGRLIDGQHRLTAIAESDVYNGKSLEVRVETGADDSIREYMDTGIPRTLDDRVELDSDRAFNLFISQLITFDTMVMKGRSGKYGKATPDDAREFFELHKSALKHVHIRHRREMATGQVSVSFAAMQYFEKNVEKADEFYSDLFIPAGHVQQAQMLRDYLFRINSAGGGANGEN